MHDFLNVLQYKLDTKPIQKFCNHFQRFSLFSLDNTRSLQKICNPFQNFCFLIQNITKPMQNFCILFRNVVLNYKKVVKDGIILIKSKQTVKNFLVEERF